MYPLAQALRAIRQHFTSSLATLTTALVSFTLLFLLGLVLWNLDRVVATLESSLEVAVFLKPQADPQQVASTLSGWTEVARVEVQSKEDALSALQQDFPYLLEAQELVTNPLPNTLRLSLVRPQDVRAVASRIRSLPEIDDLTYGGEITERLIGVLGGLRFSVNILMALLLANTLFSVMGTIRLSMDNRRDELRVMMLVGASRSFAQAPFLWEGVLLTTQATLLALLLGGSAYWLLARAVQEMLPFLPILSMTDLLQAGGALLALSLVLGWLGAFISSRIHLRETHT